MDEQANQAGQPYRIRALAEADRNWVAHFLDKHWGSTKIVARGNVYYAHLLPGLAVEMNDAPDDAPPVGLLTYTLDDAGDCHIITINSLEPNVGVGTLMIDAVKSIARENACKRVWLIVTNDNLNALRFYQKRGFKLVMVHRDALAAARKLKPQIPLVGQHDIPLYDEIELECRL